MNVVSIQKPPSQCAVCFQKFMKNHTPQQTIYHGQVMWTHIVCGKALLRGSPLIFPDKERPERTVDGDDGR